MFGSIISGVLGFMGQKETNAQNMQLSQDQMRFQADMSNTAHQREVADLRAAGLNPILSGTGGAGASAPVGSAAKMESELGAGGQAALQGALAEANIDNLNEQNQNLKKTGELLTEQRRREHEGIYQTYWDATEKEAAANLRHQQVLTERQRTLGASYEAQILGNSAKGSDIEGDIDSSTYGKIMRYIDRSEKTLRGIGHLKPR